jgi:chromosome segregation ATPase
MSAQKLMYKWWKDNDRYIQDPWAEISLLQEELKQMCITEAALRESLTGLSRESNEYRHKIETENATLREKISELEKAFAPNFVRELHIACLELERENAALRNKLASYEGQTRFFCQCGGVKL